MKKLWTLCTCCLSVGMMWAQTGNWTDEGNYDTSWWDGNNWQDYHTYLVKAGHFLQAALFWTTTWIWKRIIGFP